MTVECVTLASNHYFAGNPLAEQHRLRYRSIISRQGWDVPSVDQMEYDQYDTPATVYFIWRDDQGIARGSARLIPTSRPFMLQDFFSHMVQYQDMPKGDTIWEGSRFCIDKTLTLEQRQRVAYEIVLAYLEYGLDTGVQQILGLMYPIYWQNLFIKTGWHLTWLGEVMRTPDGKKSRAAMSSINHETLLAVRASTGIYDRVLYYGQAQEEHRVRAA